MNVLIDLRAETFRVVRLYKKLFAFSNILSHHRTFALNNLHHPTDLIFVLRMDDINELRPICGKAKKLVAGTLLETFKIQSSAFNLEFQTRSMNT